MIIFGDLLSMVCQSLNKVDFENIGGGVNEPRFRLNLPATLSVGKGEIMELTSKFDIKKIKGFGCPLLNGSHKIISAYKKAFNSKNIKRNTIGGIRTWRSS